MKIKFHKTMEYNGRIFKSGEIYDLEEEKPGFIDRWIKRGCSVVEEKKEVAKVEEKEENVVEEEKVEKPKRRGRRKKAE